MKNRIVMTFGSVALLTMVSSAAFGYVLLSPARRWFPPLPITVRVDSGGLASVNDGSNGTNAAAAAVGAWDNGSVNVVNGQVANVTYTNGDGQVDIIFGDPRHLCTGSCLAATLTGYYNTGSTGSCGGLSVVEVEDADVAFNLSYNYTTAAEVAGGDPCSSEIYLESVVTHEVGHVIGLGHSSVSSALMAPTVSYCVNKQLASDDFAGENALYNCTFSGGGGGGCSAVGQSCSANSDCCSNSCKGKPGSKTCK